MKPDTWPGSGAAFSTVEGELESSGLGLHTRYTSGGELGRGGMGVVWSATDNWLDREVAIKRPHADLSAGLRARLVREARITSRLVHPGIVPIYDVGQDSEGPYYTMPVLVGTTLQDRLGKPDYGVVQAVRDLLAAARAVAYAHEHGVVHRDLKPLNILLGAFGEVWVLDWGVALDPDALDEAVVGTTGFQSPEQARGGPVGPPSDVYSLGCTLRQVLQERDADDPELTAILTRSMQREPADRYPDAGAFSDELGRWLAGRRVHAHAYTAGEVLRRALLRYRLVLTTAALAVLVVAVVVVAAWNRTRIDHARALAAEEVSSLALREADHTLGVSLSQQAHQHLRGDARPEAEVLAAAALEIGENVRARGVLMAWHGLDRPEMTSRVPLPCADPLPAPDGGFVCLSGDQVRVLDQTGMPVEVFEADRPVIDGKPNVVLGYESGRVFSGGMLLQRNALVELWSEGARTGVVTRAQGFWRVAGGPSPGLLTAREIGFVDLEQGKVDWLSHGCPVRVERSWVDGDWFAVACLGPGLVAGNRSGSRQFHELPATFSTVLLTGNILVAGTFEGSLWHLNQGVWSEHDSGVGPVAQLEALGHGRVAVRGESGLVRIWDVEAGVMHGSLPGRARRMQFGSAGLRTIGAQAALFQTLTSGPPAVMGDPKGGGYGFLSVSGDGSTLLSATSHGEVHLWDSLTGQLLDTPTPDGVEHGAVVHRDLMVLVTQQRVYRLQASNGWEPEILPLTLPRRTRRVGDSVVGLGYAAHWWTASGSEHQAQDHGAVLVAVSSDNPPWLVDEAGRVYRAEAGAVVEQFQMERPSGDIDELGDGVVVTNRESVIRYTANGTEQWRWTGPTRLTALAASESHVVVGDAYGRVSVLSPDGVLRAVVQGHERLVADVVIHDQTAWSASWDGSVRRWGLEVTHADREALAAQVREAWPLSVDEAIMP